MLHKLIFMGLAGLLSFTCISGALAAPTQLAESVKTGNADTYVIEGETYEDDFQKEYEEPAPALTNEENAYQKWVAFCQAFGISCNVTYEEFLSNFAASGLEHIETYLVQCIEETYEIYGKTNVGEGKARPESVQNASTQDDELENAYIALTEYTESLGMPMMMDYETFCAQYASSGLYDVDVYLDQCKDAVYAAFLQAEEGAAPLEDVAVQIGATAEMGENSGGESELNSVSGDDFKREYEDVYTERSDEENAYQKLCLFYEALFSATCPVTYANFLNGFNTSGLDTVEAYLGQCIDEYYEQYDEPVDDTKALGQAWYFNTGTSLPRRATYTKYDLLSLVQKGDILYETKGGFAPITGHAALVEGVFWSTTQSQFYIRVIEAVSPGGVCRGVFDETRLEDKRAVIVRLKSGSNRLINSASIFATNQLGKDYSFPGASRRVSASSSGWYCSELVWASYYNSGVNLDDNNGTGIIWPAQLYGSKKTYAVIPSKTKPAARYTDITNHWAYTAIAYMLNNGVMSGTSYTKFEPNTNVTRAMFVSLLYRLAGRPNVSSSELSGNTFSDVRNSDSYYYYAVAWASSKGIVAGYTDGTFKPDGLVTREQCASFLYRFARYKNLNLSYSAASLNQFTDVSQVSSYALVPMKWAVSKGIMSGTTTTTLSPQSTCTRAMSAQLLKKMIEKLM